MRHLLTKHLKRTKNLGYHAVITLIAATVVLSGCATPGEKKPEPETSSTIEQPRQDLPLGYSKDHPASEFTGQFSSAEQYLRETDWLSAEAVLATIPADQCSATDNQYLSYLQARILYVRGDQSGSRDLLIALGQSKPYPALAHAVMSFQRYMNRMSGNYLTSAQLGDQLLRHTGDAAEAESLKREIWRDLLRVKATQIETAIDNSADLQWRGWLELAKAETEAITTAEQVQALKQWHDSYPLHPAARTLPGGMDYLLDQPDKPEKVAILLPLSGRLAPAAQAVRDGYLASYYAGRAAGEQDLELEILDIVAFDSATTAYRTAVANGASFVVGPLSKQAVEELGNLPDRPVPVLALNRIDGELPVGKTALVQLALAPEDEASQIAGIAFGQGARRALVLRPAGLWGNKVEQALRTRWISLGGTVAATATYSSREDYSNSMSTALSLPASEQRAREVRRMLAEKVEFTARRRQDIDVVFMLSKSGVEARSLKPLLAYHYAADLPVYATSNIFRGIPDPRDRDLNGVNLVETPWLLGFNPELRAAISAGEAGSDSYARLNALGADAFLLQSRFNQLQAGQNMLIQGNTGLLSLTPQLHIQRELRTATFDGGTLVAH